MKILSRLAALAAAFVFLLSAAFAQTDVMARYVKALNDIAGAIESVDSEASAREAARTIARVNAELEELSDIVEAMDPATRVAAFQSHGMEFVQAQHRMSTAMQNMMAHPEYFQIINNEMLKMPSFDK